jgi:hypothetical protein
VADRTEPAQNASPDAAAPSAAATDKDVALIHSVTSDGAGLNVIRYRDGTLSAGAIRPLAEGKPIHGEVVRLTPRPQCPLVCDVDVQLPAVAAVESDRRGPAQVANEAYRRNWDAIWRRPASDGDLVN